MKKRETQDELAIDAGISLSPTLIEHAKDSAKVEGFETLTNLVRYLLTQWLRQVNKEIARKPESQNRDESVEEELVIERYMYQGYKIEIVQNSETTGTECPTYFALSYSPTGAGCLTKIGHKSQHAFSSGIGNLKRATEVHVDKRIRWQEMRRARKAQKRG